MHLGEAILKLDSDTLVAQVAAKILTLYTFCDQKEDSVQHMLLKCPVSVSIWSEIENWIQNLAVLDYNISDKKKILGELEKALCLNSIILITRKYYLTPLNKRKKHTVMIKSEVFLFSRKVQTVYER